MSGEWGTPDPRNAGAYPALATTTMKQWAWQFLRRRDDYRSEWSKLVKPFLDGRGGFDAAAVWHASMEGSRLARQEGRSFDSVPPRPWEALRDRFKVFSLQVYTATPEARQREPFEHERHLPPRAPTPANTAEYAAAYNVTLDPRLDKPPPFDGLGVVVVEVQQVPVAMPKMLIEFDVSLPLEPQIEGARYALRLEASKVEAVRPATNMQVDKFPRYLRLLDFDEVGASDVEIGEHLFPGRRFDKKLRDVIRRSSDAARRCRDDYYRIAVSDA